MPGGRTKTLSLCEKLQLIEEHEQQKVPVRQLALVYGVGKTQVYETLKNKEKIKSELQKGTSGQRRRMPHSISFGDINKIMWDWFTARMAEGLVVSGPMIQAEALRVAYSLGRTDFKASNGWLESFRSRHNIVSNQLRVGAKDVIVVIKADWKDHIPKIIEGVSEEDIFMAVETGLRYKMLPPEFGDCCERLGVLLCMNMKGTLLQPLVVGKIARPKSFGKLGDTLPVQWMPSSQGCMTNFVLEEWLHCFNQVAALGDRKVTLFLDVESAQPVVSLSNVRLVRCPQPLDREIVFHFKCLFRKNLLQTILLKVGDSSVGEACQKTSVLEAVNWISRAVSNIPCDLVRKCFIKSGFCDPLEGADISDEAEQIVCAEISELCARLNLDAQEVIRFDDVAEDDMKIKEEPVEDEKMSVESFCDAIKVLNDLEKFAAAKCCPQLLNVLQDTKETLAQACLDS